MGNRLIAGRDFTWTDLYDKRQVAMVSENLARELWREPAAALGKRIRENRKAPWREIVGVVSDERDDGVDQEGAGDRVLADADGELHQRATIVRAADDGVRDPQRARRIERRCSTRSAWRCGR